MDGIIVWWVEGALRAFSCPIAGSLLDHCSLGPHPCISPLYKPSPLLPLPFQASSQTFNSEIVCYSAQ
ncbi:hypothetical protein OIU74_018320 [Salix koriyanagi]|uniref:Uncharacterized protein n=1 Tax=Salix koriyanagi TaxID=2511006 RepID=A0A9Q0WRR9_9ROSI|nr:hypothetical protein OIU74_018320 [Salix koriyanagi]